jgi:hypothetical protein
MFKTIFAAAVLVVAATQPVRGAIVFAQPVDLTGTGLGAVNTILTVTSPGATTDESGCVAFGGVTGAPACFGTGNTGGDEQPGVATQTRTIAQSGATSAAAFVIVLNALEPAGNSVSLDSLSVQFYDPTGAVLYTASLAAPVNIPDTAPGAGNAGFAFVLDPVQRAEAQTAGAFSNPANVIGLSATLSDATGGFETFFVASRPAVGVPFDVDPIPEPATYLTLGAGLVMLGFSHRRMVRRGQR